MVPYFLDIQYVCHNDTVIVSLVWYHKYTLCIQNEYNRKCAVNSVVKQFLSIAANDVRDQRCLELYSKILCSIYWVTKKLPQICTVILRTHIGKVA